MYSVVLLTALMSGGEQPACHRSRDWCGGYDSYGCYGRRAGRHYGCCGYYGGYDCCGYYSGWTYGSGGYYVGYAYSAVSYTAPATIIVSLPADAKLMIDDAATISTSARRVFQSPDLPTGKDFHYMLKADFTHDGKPVVISKQITVRAGQQTDVKLEADTSGVASK